MSRLCPIQNEENAQLSSCEALLPFVKSIAVTCRAFVRNTETMHRKDRRPKLCCPARNEWRLHAAIPRQRTHLQESADRSVIVPVGVERHLHQPRIAHNPAVVAGRENPRRVFRYFPCTPQRSQEHAPDHVMETKGNVSKVRQG